VADGSVELRSVQPLVDLRSDTVTKPTPQMRAAMAAAEVGDDVYGEAPTVNVLETEAAALFGHEAALFTPSGSMANQIAIQLLIPPGSELICDADAHLVNFEMGAAAAYGGISSRTWPPAAGEIEPDRVAAMVRPAGGYTVDTRAIAVEQTHNLGGGAVIPLDTLRVLRGVADDAGIGLHCDGARIWHAHVADGVPLSVYGGLFDTLSVCLSKGLGAPVGSLVLSTAERIDRARWIRKRLGGGMRQAGIIAAGGLYALRNHVARLADDHARAARIAEAMAPFGVLAGPVRTNIVVLDLTKSTVDAQSLVAAASERGVLFSPLGPRTVRLVTHLDVDDAATDRVISALQAVFRA
jgi:threonine aldolase